MPRQGLDDRDRLILDLLRRDSRISISAIATAVHLAATPVRARVKRLRHLGYIKRYTIEEEVNVASIKAIKFLFITLADQQEVTYQNIKSCLIKHASVSWAGASEGDIDFIVRIDEREQDELRYIIRDLRNMPGVRHTRTCTIVEQIIPVLDAQGVDNLSTVSTVSE